MAKNKKTKKNKIRKRIKINGEKVTKYFRSKLEAEEWHDSIKNGKGVKFNFLCEQYLATRVSVKPTTRKDYTSTIKNHLLPDLKSKKLYELTQADGLLVMQKMKDEGKSDSTVNKTLRCLKTLGKFAVDQGYMDKNIFYNIRGFKIDPENYPYWRIDKIKDFIKNSEGIELFHVFRFTLNTGLRRGEILGLKGSNIKKEGEKWSLVFNKQLLPGRREQTVKSGKFRKVPLSQTAIDILKSLGEIKEDEYVFKNKEGLPFDPNYVTVGFKKEQQRQFVVKNNRLPTAEERKKFMKFHGMRHSFASELSRLGVPIQIISRFMGHSSTKITERYIHAATSDLHETVQAVSF